MTYTLRRKETFINKKFVHVVFMLVIFRSILSYLLEIPYVYVSEEGYFRQGPFFPLSFNRLHKGLFKT